jgi:uracil phosphoribosyltransferase
MPFLYYDFLTDYSKLPPSPPVDQVFLLDPLIATGGTACAALGMIVDWGIPGMVSLFREIL